MKFNESIWRNVNPKSSALHRLGAYITFFNGNTFCTGKCQTNYHMITTRKACESYFNNVDITHVLDFVHTVHFLPFFSL